jgi:hypothetical protein
MNDYPKQIETSTLSLAINYIAHRPASPSAFQGHQEEPGCL